jgi:hypothetical protein
MLRVRLSKARAERLASERRRQAKRRSNGTSSSNKGTLGRAEVNVIHALAIAIMYTLLLYMLLLCKYYCNIAIAMTDTVLLASLLLPLLRYC